MSGQVYTSEKFNISKERMKELAQFGIEKVGDVSEDDIELEEVKYGEEVIGECDEWEREIFPIVYKLIKQAASMDQYLAGKSIAKMGNIIAEGSVSSPADLADHDLVPETEEYMNDYFRTMRLAEMMKSIFYFTLEERFEMFSSQLGVRKGFKVVKAGSKV